MPAGAGAPHSLPLREVRTRLTQLVALAELSGTVTLITRDNDPRPVAAIAPATAVTSSGESPQARASAAGWQRRLEQVRANLHRQHQGELNAVIRALDQVWAELDRHVRPGSDRDIERLRAAHAHLLGR